MRDGDGHGLDEWNAVRGRCVNVYDADEMSLQ